jgi:hypothetical protein
MFTTKPQNIDRFSCSIVSATRLYGRREMEGGEEVEKEGNMSQLAGVQFLLSNEGKVRGIIVCVCLFLLCYFS